MIAIPSSITVKSMFFQVPICTRRYLYSRRWVVDALSLSLTSVFRLLSRILLGATVALQLCTYSTSKMQCLYFINLIHHLHDPFKHYRFAYSWACIPSMAQGEFW